MVPMYNESSPQCHMRPQAFGNNAPAPCHGSCVHGNFPACNVYWPPCYPPQVPYHSCCVNHSGVYPHTSYAPPPFCVYPGYHQPWYGSDVAGEHCCGKCYPKNERGVVIEEHEPEVVRGSRGEDVLHVRSSDGPCPTMWIPGENIRTQEHGSENQDQVKASENMTVQKYFPNPWNGCFPFDEKTFKSLVQNQDRKKAEIGKAVEVPFDFSKLMSMLQGQGMKEGEIQKTKEEPGHLLQSQGVKEGQKPQNVLSVIRGNEDRKPQTEGNFERNVLSDVEKKVSLRSIPVEKHVQVPRNIPVKLSASHLPKPTEPTKTTAKKTEPVGNAIGEKPLSPPKAPRLPPVCLRVDPLPKRKNSCSKSVNSPRRKEQPLKSEETNFTSQLSSKKAETKTVPEVCSSKCEEANKEMKMFEECLNAAGTGKESVESISNLQEVANCEIVKHYEAKENEVKPAKKTFTEEEAAIVIQSRFRGYDVRRWEPIKKLKEITNVRDQMADIIKRIKTLEASTDQHIEEKQIVILGEMVMNLLLKLDSVQGLHPSIRDQRKSLARELSDIEDKLDSMKTSEAITEKETVEQQVEITSQTSDCPVNLEHIQLAEENRIVPDTNTELTEREVSEETKKLMEENQQFKEMMETLVKAGREQLEVISKLTGRVKSLEKKLSHKKRRTHIGVRKHDRVKHATKPVSTNLKDDAL